MKRRVLISLLVILLSHLNLLAQRVLYSPVTYDRYSNRFEVAGKTENNYWLLSEEQVRSKHYHGIAQSFLIYDSRLNHINDIPHSW